MGSHKEDFVMESTADSYEQISQKLIEDGLKPDSDESEKLLFLWHINLQTQDELQKAREAEKKLKDAQAEEMKEVNDYLENIRHLLDGRELFIQELETENETLKAQVATLEQESSEASRAEITEMLTQQGLAEISNSMQSEQIAYLLMERARLLDEVEERASIGPSQTNGPGNPSGVELASILERERKDFEEELKQQRENAKTTSEQLKQEHEEEIDALMDENNKLEEDLQKAEMVVSQLKAELSKYADEDDVNSNMNQSLKASIEEERRRLLEERKEINRDREDLEKAMSEAEEDHVDFTKRLEQFNQEKTAFDREKSNFHREKVKLEQVKNDIENEKQKLERERASVRRKSQDEAQKLSLSETRNIVKDESGIKEKEQKEVTPSSRGTSLIRSPSDLTVRKIIEEKTKVETEVVQLKAQLRALQKEKETHDDVVSKLNKDLEKSLIQQQQLQVKNRSMKAELQDLENQLDETENKMDSITKEKKNLSEMCNTLNSEVKTLRTDAVKFDTLQDVVDILNNDKIQLSQSVESLKSKVDQAESEKTELANQNKLLSKGEQDLTNQMRVCKQEFEIVNEEKTRLETDKQELISLVQKLEDKERILEAEMEETNKMKEKFAHEVETLVKENKDLLNKLDRSREELEHGKLQLQELAKQELTVEHLKDQNLQLQKQLNMSQEELVKSRERETMLITNQQSLQKSHDGSEKSIEKLVCEIDDLKLKLELTFNELAKSKHATEELNKEKISLTENLKNLEKALKENDTIKDCLEQEKSEKNNMAAKTSRLESQLADMAVLVEKVTKDKMDVESQVESLRGVETNIKSVSQELEKEKSAREALELQRKQLEKTISSQVSKAELVSALELADKEKQCRSVLELQVAELEQSVKDAEAEYSSASEQVKNKEKLILSLENKIKDLQNTIASQVTANEHSELKEELARERAALAETTRSLQNLSMKLEEERTISPEVIKQEDQVDSTETEITIHKLKTALDELDQERAERVECDLRLQELEQLLEDQKADNENLHHSMNAKILSLEKRAKTLQDDLFATQDELQELQEKYDEAVSKSENAKVDMAVVEVMSQQTKRETESVQTQQKHTPPAREQNDKDEETSAQSAFVQLQESLNELNTAKSELCQVKEELKSSCAKADTCRQEIFNLKQSLQTATKEVEISDEKLKTLRHELVETQGTLKLSQNLLREKQLRLDSFIQDKEEAVRELDAVQEQLQQHIHHHANDPLIYGENERQLFMDKALMFERLSKQLEQENRETARKLTDAVRKCEILEEHLQKEKLRNADKYQQINKYTSQQEKDIITANNQVRQLREELHKQQAKTFRMELDNLGLTAKYQGTVARLEQEIKELKQRNGQELASLRDRMGSLSSEATALREQKRDTEQELAVQKLELSRIKSDNERLEKHLQAESKMKISLEGRNSVIDSEISQMWSQTHSLMEKYAALESANQSLERDLSVAKSTVKQLETVLAQKETVHEASIKTAMARAEVTERKTKDLQKHLEELTERKLDVERQLAQVDLGNVQVQDTKDTLLAVRHQLNGEKLQRSILEQTVAELNHQVALLKQRESNVISDNKELQHTILDLESHLSFLQSQSNVDLSMHQQISEVSKGSLLDQINRLQREVKQLQQELYTMSERRDTDVKRYEERKLRTKAKLMKARCLYTAERNRFMEHMKNTDEDLRLTQATLVKEKEWGSKMDESYKMLLSEKRDLITQLSEAEETMRDKARTLSMAQAKISYLEEENIHLRDMMQDVTEQKRNLSKQLKSLSNVEANYEMPPSNERTGNSGYKSNQEKGWDSSSTSDEFGNTWPTHIDPPAKFRKANSDGANIHVTESSSDVDDGKIICRNITDTSEGKISIISHPQKSAKNQNVGSVYTLCTNIDDGVEFDA